MRRNDAKYSHRLGAVGSARHQPKTFTNRVQPHLEYRHAMLKVVRLAWDVRVHVLAASPRYIQKVP